MKKLVRRIINNELINRFARVVLKSCGVQSVSIFKSLQKFILVSGRVSIRLGDQNIVLWAAADDSLATKMYYNNEWEKDVVYWFVGFTRVFEEVIDAGSNIGVFALVAAKSNSKAIVNAFEPNPYNFKRLQTNVTLNKLQDRIHMHCVALGEGTDVLTFYVPQGDWISDVSSVFNEHTTSFSNLAHRPIQVPCVSLDQFCSKNGLRPKVIKIDVELYELQVLRGMRNILSADKPFIFCEIFNDEVKRKQNLLLDDKLPKGYTKSIEEFLREHDYHFYLITASGILYVEQLKFSPISSMYLLLPRKLSQSFYLPQEIDIVITELKYD